MFQPGTLIYFNPFYLKNGAASKPKYFIVLKEIDDQYILANAKTVFVKVKMESLTISKKLLKRTSLEKRRAVIPAGCRWKK